MHQSKKHSLLEVCLGTAIGFIIAYTANLIIFPVFGWSLGYGENFLLTCFFTVISIVRGYAVRRLFNWLHWKEYL